MIKGFEFEVCAVPVEGLQFDLATGYTDAEYDDFFANLTGSRAELDNLQ